MAGFEHSDAWIFLSVAYSAQDAPAGLDAFYAAADHINCAIPTDEETEGGINRLASAGLVCVEAGRFALSDLGRRIFTRVCEQNPYPRMQPELVEQHFEKAKLPTVVHSEWKLLPAESASALRRYQKEMKVAFRVLRKTRG